MAFDFCHFYEALPYFIKKKCKGFEYIDQHDDNHENIMPGGHIRYFTRTPVPQFKMGGKVVRRTLHFIEFENRKKTYIISPHKYYILYKAPRKRKSKRYKLLKSFLEDLETSEKPNQEMKSANEIVE